MRNATLGLAALLLSMPACAPAQQVRLDVRLAKPVLLAAKKETTYLKVGLTGFDRAKNGERARLNVAIVLDKSGSMSGEKMRKAKEATLMAIERMGPDDIVSVVAYDSTVRVLVPATKVSDRALIAAGVRRIVPGGNTALFAGVSKGADELRKFLDRNRVNRVILLSDGLANVGPSAPSDLERLGMSLIKEGVSVTTIGLGLDYNEDLMSRLSRASDGNHVFVERADDLGRFFALEFGDVTAVVAQDVTVRIKCAPGVRPVRVLGRDADIVGQEVTARLNQLISRREKFLMVEVEVPAGEPGDEREVVEVEVSYGNMVTKATDSLSATVRASFTASAAEMERRTDRAVVVNAVELVSNERNREAVVARDQGKLREARELLLENARWLDHNATTLRSTRLEQLKSANEDDAKNLAPAKWKGQRKRMRRKQYKLDLQQAY